MAEDLSIRDQLAVVRELVSETHGGKALWEVTGSPGVYSSARNGTTAILDDTGTTQQPSYRLRFVDDGQPDFTVVIQQRWSDAAFPEEQELDVYLAGLYQLVRGKVARAGSPVAKYFGRDV